MYLNASLKDVQTRKRKLSSQPIKQTQKFPGMTFVLVNLLWKHSRNHLYYSELVGVSNVFLWVSQTHLLINITSMLQLSQQTGTFLQLPSLRIIHSNGRKLTLSVTSPFCLNKDREAAKEDWGMQTGSESCNWALNNRQKLAKCLVLSIAEFLSALPNSQVHMLVIILD